MNNELKLSDKLTEMENVLDKLVDAQGRAKCGYIWVLTHLISDLRKDINELETKLALIPESSETH